MEKPRRFRSLFWPILLIAVGLIWLLNALGYLPSANIETLLSFWPLLLVFLGLDILIGRRSGVGRIIISVLLIIVVVVILFAAPMLKLPGVTGMQNKQISETVGNATSAVVDLHLSSAPTDIHSINSTQNILQADIDYFGNLNYSATGETIRNITIEQNNYAGSFNVGFNSNPRWDIGLSQAVPIDLTIDGSAGSANIDLTGLQLTGFMFDQGAGSFDVKLPASTEGYTVEAIGGAGSMHVQLPAQSNLEMHLTGHSGSIHINLPNNAAVHIEVQNSGAGSINLPGNMQQVSTFGNKEGVWETNGYATASYHLVIICEDLGAGSLSFR